MIRTVTIDIINEKAIKLLQDLELLDLIRLHKDTREKKKPVDWITNYKGAMTRQPLGEVDKQLNGLRNEWE